MRKIASGLVGVVLAGATLAGLASTSMLLSSARANMNPGIDVGKLASTPRVTRKVEIENLVFFDYDKRGVVFGFDTTGNGRDDIALFYELGGFGEGVILVGELTWASIDLNDNGLYEGNEIIPRERFEMEKDVWENLRAVTIERYKMTLRFDRLGDGIEDLAFFYRLTGHDVEGFSTMLIGIADDFNKDGVYSTNEFRHYSPGTGSGM